MLVGGGLHCGWVIGRSSRDGALPRSTPVIGRNSSATVFHTHFDVGLPRLVPNLPREFGQTMASWEPIPGLVS